MSTGNIKLAHNQELETIYNRRMNQDKNEISEAELEVDTGFDAVFFTNGKSRKWTPPLFDSTLYSLKKFAVPTNKVAVVKVPVPKHRKPVRKRLAPTSQTTDLESVNSSGFKLEKVYPEEIEPESENTLGEPDFFVANVVQVAGTEDKDSKVIGQHFSKKTKLAHL